MLLSRVENWRATEIISVRFQLPPRQTQRSDFPNWAFLLVSPKGLCDLPAGSAFMHGNILSCNHCIILMYYRAMHYSTCSSQSHVVFLHAEDVFLSSFQPNLL